MVTKKCKQCGCTMTVASNRVRLCDSCRTNNRKYHDTVYMKKYTKTNRQALTITKEDNDALEIISVMTKISKAKIIHYMIKEIYGDILYKNS